MKSWSAGPSGAPAFEFAYEDYASCFSTGVGHFVMNYLNVFPDIDIPGRLKGELSMMDDYLSKRDAEEGLPYESISKGSTTRHPMKVINKYAKGLYGRLKALQRPDIVNCLESLSSSELTFSKVYEIMNTIAYARPSEIYCHSKLHFLSDKGGKTRVIAMGDVLTQTLVQGLHQEIFVLLKKLATDGTMDQMRQRERVRTASRGPRMLYSIDMKSCTDRLPAIYQLLVLYFSGLLSMEQSVA